MLLSLSSRTCVDRLCKAQIETYVHRFYSTFQLLIWEECLDKIPLYMKRIWAITLSGDAERAPLWPGLDWIVQYEVIIGNIGPYCSRLHQS